MNKQFLVLLALALSLFSHATPAASELETTYETEVADKNVQLLKAAENNNIERLKELLAEKADVNTADEYERTSLHWASHHGNIESVKLLLDAEANIDALDQLNQTPLSIACYNNQVECAQLLVNRGADVNIVDGWGCSPLHWASASEKVEFVEFLLNAGADASIKNYLGDAPIDFAQESGHKKIVKILQDWKDIPTLKQVEEVDQLLLQQAPSSSSKLKRKREHFTGEEPAHKRCKNEKAEVCSDDEDSDISF